ncbi:hypothetical protein NC652_037826 [Populus alba x Populus x berolinensis]|nr:hypothetical protein NC652_037826 [Populus alba x Populus x berolinensis]
MCGHSWTPMDPCTDHRESVALHLLIASGPKS